VALAAWRYAWSTTPVHRWEMSGSWPADAPPALPGDVDLDGIQPIEDGVGPLLHRLYRTQIVASPMTAEELMGRIFDDLDVVAPSEFATFQKLGDNGPLRVGDEYVVRMPGPWDGPVRVLAADPTSFRLGTLDGHLEAGQIEFRATADYRSLYFEIESWARNGDRVSDLLYTRLRFSKEVQLHMWSSLLRRVTALAGGRMEQGLTITTRRLDPERLPAATAGGGDAATAPDRALLEAIASLPVNFDPDRIDDHFRDPGWHRDDLVEPLPDEGSGPPEAGGSFLVARELMDGYQLADPAVVTATFDRETPLEGRDMALEVRFWGLRFRIGVRVGEVYESTTTIDGREVLIYGWTYRTLEGHFEEGQMHYELWKWLDRGDVEFHLRSVSRPARSGPLWRRLGFRLFGRINQLRFYRQICRRVRRLTESQLETERFARSRQAKGTSIGG
jgi:uncharacterized protein (UPF0548 family)